MGKQKSRKVKELQKWLTQHANALLDDPSNGIIAVGLGKKSAGPINDESPFCITGFVERKLSKKELKARSVTEFTASLAAVSVTPVRNLGFEIDVVDAGSTFSAQPGLRVEASQRGSFGGSPPSIDLQKRFNMLRAGIGITNPENAYPNTLSVGTLGFFVRDDNDKLYLVSNNHVIANENNAGVGDAIVQPGTLDLTNIELILMNSLPKLRNQLEIGKLSAWVDIQFHSSVAIPFNEVDCAIAEVNSNARSLAEVARVGLGGVLEGVGPNYRIDLNTGQVRGSTRVYKAGRTTGWTEGDVSALNVVSNVSYGAGVARFRNQIAITATADNSGPFSDSGDSGSGILNQDHKLVGLLFAGSKTRTLVNPIRKVLNELETVLNRGNLKVVQG